jgi:hypothetical protein
MVGVVVTPSQMNVLGVQGEAMVRLQRDPSTSIPS